MKKVIKIALWLVIAGSCFAVSALEPFFELRTGKECKVLFTGLKAGNQRVDFPGGTMTIARDRIGSFIRYRVIFSSEEKDPVLLEIAATAVGKLDGKIGFFDGNREHELNKVRLARNTHLETFPLTSVWDSRRGFALGFVPETNLSYFSTAAERKAGDVALTLAARVVLDNRKKQEVTFLALDFQPEFKWANSIQCYYDTFPDAFAPVSGIDQRIYGIGGYHGGAHAQRMIQLQSSRYHHLDWDWCFHTRDGGDDWYTAGAKFKTKKVARYYGIGKPKMCDPKEFSEVTKREFDIGSRICAELFYILVTDVHNRQAAEFPEVDQGPSYMCNPKFARACFVPGSPLFDILVKQLQKVTEEYNISGFAFDMANSSYRFRTKSQMDYATGRAFDEEGVIYTCDTIVENAFADAVHKMHRGNLPMAVYMNMALSDFSAFTVFKADGIMFEGNPDINLAAVLPLRLMSGRKPVTFFASVAAQRRNTGILWDRANAKEIRDINNGLALHILFKSLQWGISPMNWALYHDNFRFYAPWIDTIIAIKKAGFQPVTAVRGKGSEKLWIGRFGSGRDTIITISNPQRSAVDAELEVVTGYFGGKSYILLPSAAGELKQNIKDGGTFFRHRFAPKEIMVLRAVEADCGGQDVAVSVKTAPEKVEITADKVLQLDGLRHDFRQQAVVRTEPSGKLDNGYFSVRSARAVLHFAPVVQVFNDDLQLSDLFANIRHAEYGSARHCETVAMMAGMYRPHLAGARSRGGVPGRVEPGFMNDKYAVPDIAIHAPGKAPAGNLLIAGTMKDFPELAAKLSAEEKRLIALQRGGFVKIIANKLWIGGNTPDEVYCAGIKFFGILDKSPLPPPIADGKVCFDGKSAAAWQGGKISAANGVLSCSVPFNVMSAKSIPVEAGKVYTLSGEFRIAGAKEMKHFYVGLELLDAKGRVISHLSAVPAGQYSIAAVAEDVPAGAKEMVLDKAVNWPEKAQYCSLAFNARADRSDLPNFDISPGIKQLIRENGRVKVIFAKPLNKAVKAGTAVRLHRGGDVFMFVGANNRTLKEGFQRYAGRFSTTGDAGVYKLFPGTAAVRPVIWTWNVSKGKLEFRNVKVILGK